MLNQLKLWAKKLKKQLFILYLAYKDERVSCIPNYLLLVLLHMPSVQST